MWGLSLRGGLVVVVTSRVGKISRANVFFVPKSRRCSKRMPNALRLRYETRSSTIRVSQRSQEPARRVPVPQKSHF